MTPTRSVVPFIEPQAKRNTVPLNLWPSLFTNGQLDFSKLRNRNPVHALANPTFSRCVQLKAGIIAALPKRLIDRKTKQVAEDHPAHRILQRPNSEQTAPEFWLMQLTNYFTHGNCYAEKVISRGQVVELLPMCASFTTVEWGNGQKVYRYSSPSMTLNLPGRLVLHFRQFGEGDLTGLSPAWRAEQAILLDAAQHEMILDLSEGAGTPKLMINLPPEQVLKRIEDLDPNWRAADRNLIQGQIEGARTRLALYLPHGYQGTPLSANFDDLQVQQTRDFAVADIARIHGVPLSKLGVMSRSENGKTTEQNDLEFYKDTLLSDIVNIEKRLESDLLTEQDQARYQIKFNVAAILRADLKTQVESWVMLMQQGAMVSDEARELMDWEPFGTPESTTPRFPVNMTTENVPSGSQPTNPADGGVPARGKMRGNAGMTRDSLPAAKVRSLDARLAATRMAKPMFMDTVARIVRKEKAEIGRIARAALAGRAGVGDVEAALKRLYEGDGDLRQFIEKNLDKPVQVLFDAIRVAMEEELGMTFPDEDLRKIVRRYVDIWARQYAQSSENQLLDLIQNGGTEADILEAIELRLDEWEEKRADKEATDETSRGRNVFAKALYSLAGVSVLRWVTSGSPCELCTPLDGRTFSLQSIPQCPLHRGCECSYTAG